MSTIEELESQAIGLQVAEAAGVRRLIGHIRDVAVELPEGSQLAGRLAVCARALEPYARRPPAAQYATNELNALRDELSEDRMLYEDDGEAD